MFLVVWLKGSTDLWHLPACIVHRPSCTVSSHISQNLWRYIVHTLLRVLSFCKILIWLTQLKAS